jgi:hypothetical protein
MTHSRSWGRWLWWSWACTQEDHWATNNSGKGSVGWSNRICYIGSGRIWWVYLSLLLAIWRKTEKFQTARCSCLLHRGSPAGLLPVCRRASFVHCVFPSTNVWGINDRWELNASNQNYLGIVNWTHHTRILVRFQTCLSETHTAYIVGYNTRLDQRISAGVQLDSSTGDITRTAFALCLHCSNMFRWWWH